MKQVLLCIFIASFLIVPFAPVDVSALFLDEVYLNHVDIEVKLNDDGTSSLHINFQVVNNDSVSVNSLSFRLDSLSVNLVSSSSEGEIVTSSAILRDRFTEIILGLPSEILPGENRWVSLEVNVNDLQSFTGQDDILEHSYSDFTFYVRPLNTFHNFSLTVILPEDAMLSQQSVVPLFPASDTNYTDGSSMAFSWDFAVLQPGQEKVFIVKYQRPISSSSVSGYIWIDLLIFSITAFGLGVVLTMFGPRILKRIKNIGQLKIVGVTQEEQEVLDVIRSKGGSCPQKDLYREFEMSQAKVSMILSNLEERGLVRRFRDGRENMVHLVEE